MGKLHRYRITVEWTGNTGAGTANYRNYERRYEISAGPRSRPSRVHLIPRSEAILRDGIPKSCLSLRYPRATSSGFFIFALRRGSSSRLTSITRTV
jgi:hypothetical protein